VLDRPIQDRMNLTKRLMTTAVLSATLFACSARDESLPHVRGEAVPCEDPPLAPAALMHEGSDVLHCISGKLPTDGLRIALEVSPTGRVIAVTDALDLCLTIRPDGTIEPEYKLSEAERACLVTSLQDWTFAGLGSCRSTTAFLTLAVDGHSERAEQEGCKGGPTTG
jgi:hypothetical protein